MFRSLYSTSVRAAALAQPRVVPRSTLLARTIVSKYELYPLNLKIKAS
jgi:hypothetical protein